MATEFEITRRVEFADTDMAGIMHFSNFFRFMESAEHAFFRSLGISIVMNHTDPPVGFPRVHAHCDYKRPAWFEDEIRVRLIVEKLKSKSIDYRFEFFNLTRAPEDLIAVGRLSVVSVFHVPGKPMKAIPVPDELRNRLIPEIDSSPAHGKEP